jgi:hypothetical protein
MVILAFRQLADTTHCVDPGEEGGELHGPAQLAVDALPIRKRRQCGVHFFVR